MFVLCFLCDVAAGAWFAVNGTNSVIVFHHGDSIGSFVSFLTDLERWRRP